ncbi:hypothetical protein [Parafrigoribacterium soli]|uniref:hypothetical protein n=1 Tax=Parafrigoribacterium soli TaxID=3144663 RepID=UPI0032EDC925
MRIVDEVGEDPRRARVMDLVNYLAAVLVAMLTGVVFLVVGSPSSAGVPWIRAVLELIARATPIVIAVALLIGYPLVSLVTKLNLHRAVVVLLAGIAGLALGLAVLVVATFIPSLDGIAVFAAMYVSAIGAWCAVGGQLLYPLFRRHPVIALCAGVVVIALAIVGWWVGL